MEGPDLEFTSHCKYSAVASAQSFPSSEKWKNLQFWRKKLSFLVFRGIFYHFKAVSIPWVVSASQLVNPGLGQIHFLAHGHSVTCFLAWFYNVLLAKVSPQPLKWLPPWEYWVCLTIEITQWSNMNVSLWFCEASSTSLSDTWTMP